MDADPEATDAGGAAVVLSLTTERAHHSSRALRAQRPGYNMPNCRENGYLRS